MPATLLDHVLAVERQWRAAVAAPPRPAAVPALAELPPDAPVALLLSPHPDDEALTGGLPLRLRTEAGWRIVNLPITLGSAVERRARRWRELQAACDCLGFELLAPVHEAPERLSPTLRDLDRDGWQACVQRVVDALRQWRPQVVFFPHEGDVQPAHLGALALALDALQAVGKGLQPLTVRTEYWGTLTAPNLMVQLDAPQLAHLAEAAARHVGEVARNPYHLGLPAFCIDAVRRGAELVGGLGQPAPSMSFAMLYRVQRWNGLAEVDAFDGGRTITTDEGCQRAFR